MLLREVFCNSIVFAVINKYGKGGAVQISKVFVPFNMLLLEGSFETGLFRDFINHVFWRPKSREYISYEERVFFKKCSKFNLALKNGRRNI